MLSYSAYFIILLHSSLAALADSIPPVSVNLYTWKIEALGFDRSGRAGTTSTNLLDVQFNLYHPKFEACLPTGTPPVGFLGGDSFAWSEFQDPEFCVNWELSKRVVNCNSNGTYTLWRPCSGRRTITSSCGNITNLADMRPGSGCTDFREYEDESEQLWVKWRVISLEESNDLMPNITQSAWTVDPSTPFHSLVIEMVSGQRYYPNGTLPPEHQIVLYSTKFTILRNMTRCFIFSYGLGYSCELEVSQLDPWMPRGHCVSAATRAKNGLLPGFSDDCGFRTPYKYRLTSLDEFKAAYWK